MIRDIYAPHAAAKISEASILIRKAAKLLDCAGDRFVIAEIENIGGTESISTDTADRLDALALKLEGGEA